MIAEPKGTFGLHVDVYSRYDHIQKLNFGLSASDQFKVMPSAHLVTACQEQYQFYKASLMALERVSNCPHIPDRGSSHHGNDTSHV